MNFGLSNETIDRINSVFKKYPEIEQVIIYGSRAKGNYRNGSDIDIAINGNITDTISSGIFWDIDELDTPYLFDISFFHELKSPDLREHISRVGQVLYEINKKASP